uniref:trypsin n=1 Tax=Neogobius melanostomus TaxID=47308 RepID=A0A8C6TZ25_9GOBI
MMQFLQLDMMYLLLCCRLCRPLVLCLCLHPLTLCISTELTCSQKSERKQYRIVGGSFTPIESQPWVAAIFTRRGQFLCGGSLIAPCWVLTAAHCFEGYDPSEKEFTVYLGKSAINETNALKEQKFIVQKLVIHRQYNASNYNYDIALLKIKNKDGGCAVKSPSTRTVCLPPKDTQLPVGYKCSIVGYGKENAWGFSKILKEGQVNLLSQSECRSKDYYGDKVTGNMFCAAKPNWRIDACKGDSGGPLVCEVAGRMFLFGVVSWGDGCAQRNKPGVYTKVTNFNKWILKTLCNVSLV